MSALAPARRKNNEESLIPTCWVLLVGIEGGAVVEVGDGANIDSTSPMPTPMLCPCTMLRQVSSVAFSFLAFSAR